jgi:outer membrane immunogenic protein
MNGRPSLFVLSLSFLLLAYPSAAGAQVSDGTVKITRRTVSPGIGVEWGQGILTYNGRDYPFSYRAGSFRHVDTEMTTAELSGQVFNLKTIEDFGGRYHKVEAEEPATGEGSRVTMKNQKGVLVNVFSPVEGRKFDLTREGLDVELKK